LSENNVSLAILGAGNAGCSLAGELTLQGLDVSLAELPEFKKNIEVPMKKGGIQVEGELKTGFARIKKITLDIGDAISGRDIIFVASPAYGHEAFTRACAPHLEDGQSLVYISYFGALRMARLLKDLKVDKDVTVGETLSFLYASDRVGKKGAFFMDKYQDDAKVLIKREKEGLPVAAFPATKNTQFVSDLRKAVPSMVSAENVLETSINNVNPMSHPAGVIMNAGWIEHTGGRFSFYLEGQTPSINRVAGAMDEERMNVAAAFGLKRISNEELSQKMYAKYIDKKTGSTHQEKYYRNIYDAPPSLKHRYLVEDVMYGLVPMYRLAKVAGVETPIIESIIRFACVANEVNYWETGVNLEQLRLDGKSVGEVLDFVNNGI
jgi:opine dehydrogenase